MGCGASSGGTTASPHGRGVRASCSRSPRILARPLDHPPAALHGPRAEIVDNIVDSLSQTKKSVLLVGPNSVGKTRLLRAALDRIDERRPIFEAGAAQTYAGCVYVGELETKIDSIVRHLAGSNAVWVFPSLDDAIFTGQHSRSPQGMLDALLPPPRLGCAHADRGGHRRRPRSPVGRASRHSHRTSTSCAFVRSSSPTRSVSRKAGFKARP